MNTRFLHLFLLSSFLLGGCGTVSVASFEDPVGRPPSTRARAMVQPVTPRGVEPVQGADALMLDNLRSEIRAWIGTPYEWGGDDRDGVDCSAFVQNVYEDALGVRIARTTAQQQNEGSTIDRSELEPGDLIFFHTPKRTDHVGIYLSGGDFAHASSSRGVMISNLAEDYWKAAYTQARRPHQLDLSPMPIRAGLANDEPAPQVELAAPVSPSPAPRNTGKKRTGW